MLRRTTLSAGFTMAERTSASDQVGCCWRTTAAEPARCGVAIEVPWKNAQHGGAAQNACGIELSTLTPGATTSGLIRKSTSVGPWLEKPAMKSSFPDWKYDWLAETVVARPFFARSFTPSSFETM